MKSGQKKYEIIGEADHTAEMTNQEEQITIIINHEAEGQGPPPVECQQFKITEADKFVRSYSDEELEKMTVTETEQFFTKYLNLCTSDDEGDSDSDDEDDWNELHARIMAIRINPMLHD